MEVEFNSKSVYKWRKIQTCTEYADIAVENETQILGYRPTDDWQWFFQTKLILHYHMISVIVELKDGEQLMQSVHRWDEKSWPTSINNLYKKRSVTLFLTITHNDGQLIWELLVKFNGTCDHIHVQTYLYFWFFAQDHLAWCLSTMLFHRMILHLQMVKCKRWLWFSQRSHATTIGDALSWETYIPIHITRISNSISSGDTSPLHIQDGHITDLNYSKALKVDLEHDSTEGMAFEDVHVFMNHQKVNETHINLQNWHQISQF